MMQITDEMVERGARALHAREMPGEPSWLMDYYWERLALQYKKEEYRQRARACLEAALGGEPSEDVQQGRA